MVYTDGAVELEIDLRVYRLAAVKKSAYRYANRCTVVIGTALADLLPITFQFKPQTPEATAREVIRTFFAELLDQELREQIAEETQPIRALILAHAFSKVDLLRRD